MLKIILKIIFLFPLFVFSQGDLAAGNDILLQTKIDKQLTRFIVQELRNFVKNNSEQSFDPLDPEQDMETIHLSFSPKDQIAAALNPTGIKGKIEKAVRQIIANILNVKGIADTRLDIKIKDLNYKIIHAALAVEPSLVKGKLILNISLDLGNMLVAARDGIEISLSKRLPPELQKGVCPSEDISDNCVSRINLDFKRPYILLRESMMNPKYHEAVAALLGTSYNVNNDQERLKFTDFSVPLFNYIKHQEVNETSVENFFIQHNKQIVISKNKKRALKDLIDEVQHGELGRDISLKINIKTSIEVNEQQQFKKFKIVELDTSHVESVIMNNLNRVHMVTKIDISPNPLPLSIFAFDGIALVDSDNFDPEKFNELEFIQNSWGLDLKEAREVKIAYVSVQEQLSESLNDIKQLMFKTMFDIIGGQVQETLLDRLPEIRLPNELMLKNLGEDLVGQITVKPFTTTGEGILAGAVNAQFCARQDYVKMNNCQSDYQNVRPLTDEDKRYSLNFAKEQITKKNSEVVLSISERVVNEALSNAYKLGLLESLIEGKPLFYNEDNPNPVFVTFDQLGARATLWIDAFYNNLNVIKRLAIGPFKRKYMRVALRYDIDLNIELREVFDQETGKSYQTPHIVAHLPSGDLSDEFLKYGEKYNDQLGLHYPLRSGVQDTKRFKKIVLKEAYTEVATAIGTTEIIALPLNLSSIPLNKGRLESDGRGTAHFIFNFLD